MTPEEVRRDVKAWLADKWDPDLSLLEWRTKLVESGWATPTWPAEWYGRGLPGWADPIVSEEFAAVGAVGPAVGGGMGLAAPTLLAHGSDDLKRRLLPRAITGEDTWCQLFSEPTNGSDLAGLATHAERDGDEWVVNGQKLWSTSAHHADLGLLLARTDPDVPKHQGISYFVLPMHQPGIEVRPVHQMNEHSSFNEVFMSDARIPGDNIVGRPGDGWRIAMTTLAFERQFATIRARSSTKPVGRAATEAAKEAEEYFKVYAWYPQRAGRADLVPRVAELQGRTGDPIARQQMAELVALRRAHEWTARRAQAARAGGRPPGSEGSLGKLAASRVAQMAARTHSLLAGADGQLTHGDSLLDGVVTEVLLSVPAQSIAGGTDEIQHNIIGEKVLDLPHEPSVDRDIPYREIRRSVIAEQCSWRPPDLLRPYVSGYTGYRYLGFEPGEHMGLPSRHVTFVLPFDAPLELVLPNGDPTPHRFSTVVSGFHTTPAVIRHDGNQHGIQLHVTPAGARALFAMPAGEVAADAVPLDALWGPAAGELLDRLDAAGSWDERFATLDRFLLRVAAGRAEVPSGVRDETAEAFRRLLERDGRVSIAALADQVGWSRRHLTDQFVAEYGIGPKEMARVLRFERSKAMFLRPGHQNLATIAAECGYADQAHMAREWRALAGASPTQWLAAETLPVEAA